MSFKGRAKNWDNDARIKRSKMVAEKIDEMIGKEEYNSIMEYGCATGLISFYLCDKFKKVTLMDSEREMIEIVKEKVHKYKRNNIFPIQINLMNEYIGKDKVFIFKFKNGEIKKYVLNKDNEKEILQLCCEFADCKFESIDKMLRDNRFYAETYYTEILENSRKFI